MEKTFNRILGIGFPYLLMKLLSCHGFLINIDSVVILKFPKRMLEYYFSKGLGILEWNFNNWQNFRMKENKEFMQKRQIIHTMSWRVSTQFPPHQTPLRSCSYIKVYILLIFKYILMIKIKSLITPSLHTLNRCYKISIILHCFNNGGSILMLQRMKENRF